MKGTGFRKGVLDNGIRVLTEHLPGVRSLSVVVWVDHGSRDESPAVSGMSHFIEHMIFKGTARMTALDIAKAFDRLGGISNAFTSKETICFHAKVVDSHQDDILELLSDIFLNSCFSQIEIERERLVVLQEISMVEDSPEELIHDVLHRNFWPNHGLGQPVLGLPETVTRFQSEDISNYVHQYFSPEKVVIACAGNVRHADFMRKVERFFGHMSGPPNGIGRKRPHARTGFKIVEKDLEQVNCLLGFEGPGQRDERRFDALLFNVILGGSMSSRLFQEIRERRGLAYAIYSYHSGYTDTGLMGMYAGTSQDKAVEVMELMMDELQRLAEEPVSEQELHEAKEHVKGGIVLTSESTDARMNRIARLELTLGHYVTIEDVMQKIDAVTQQSIMELAQDLLMAQRSAVVMGKITPKIRDGAEKILNR